MSEKPFKLREVQAGISGDISDRTVRDTLNTMADKGWLSKDSPNSHLWNPGPLTRGEEPDEGNRLKHSSEDGAGLDPDVEVNELPSQASRMEKGAVYEGTVDRFAGRNAIVNLSSQGDHVNLGPIDKEAAGETVLFKSVSGIWGKCLDEEYIYDSYAPKDGESSTTSSGSRWGSGSSSGSRTGNRQKTKTGDVAPNDPSNKNKLLKGNM
jgi:hypothetical protein